MTVRRRLPPPEQRREWTEPGPPVNGGQLELAGCERVPVGAILHDLVLYWGDCLDQCGRDAPEQRESYRRLMRRATGLIVSMGWYDARIERERRRAPKRAAAAKS